MRSTRDLLNFGPDVPIYANIASAKEAGADVLVIGMAPSGGQLPPAARVAGGVNAIKADS